MCEIWKDVPNYEGLYQVSNLGKVKSLERDIVHMGNISRIKEKVMKPFINRGGYYCVKLSKNQKYKSFKIHRLVALAFIPNPNNYECINHKDENKKNNVVSNLEWCTKRYNNEYGSKSLWKRKVYKFDLDGNLLAKYDSITEAAKQNNFSYSSINGCCRESIRTAHGFIWCFEIEQLQGKLNKIKSNAPVGVSMYTLENELVENFNSISEACKKYNLNKSAIHMCCKGKYKTYKGYIWKYSE